MDLNELTLQSIKNYYSVLTRQGTLRRNQVYKLLMLSFITDLLDNEYSWYINEEEYGILTGLVDCLCKSACIIPFNIIHKDTEAIRNFVDDTPTRITENNEIHLAESDILRLINQ